MLCELASETFRALTDGVHRLKDTSALTTRAHKIERLVDDISRNIWRAIPVDVVGIYRRIEESFSIRPIEEELGLKMSIEVRDHFDNLRIRLLEQLLAVRNYQNPQDKGIESERVWQQFFQRQLGPEYRILQGGHVFDYKGNQAGAQIDLLIVPADAQIIVPSDTTAGKSTSLRTRSSLPSW